MPGSRSPVLSSLRIGGGIVYSFADTLEGLPKHTAAQLEAYADLLQFGEISIAPFVSYAEFFNYGRSLGVGVEAGSENLIGVGRTNARLGLFFSDDGFLPGYFNSFYSVSNGFNRIVDADADGGWPQQ